MSLGFILLLFFIDSCEKGRNFLVSLYPNNNIAICPPDPIDSLSATIFVEEYCPPEPTDEDYLHDSVYDLFAALQCADISAVSKMSTKHALASLLYIDTENFRHYEVINCNIKKNRASVSVRLNHLPYELPFSFSRQKKNRWRFEGVDIWKVFSKHPEAPYRFRKKVPF